MCFFINLISDIFIRQLYFLISLFQRIGSNNSFLLGIHHQMHISFSLLYKLILIYYKMPEILYLSNILECELLTIQL